MTRRLKAGSLDVVVSGGTDGRGGGHGPLVVLMHGFGAPGTDLVPLGPALHAPPAVRFAFPAAPLDLGPFYGGGRAWWPIDMVALQRSMQSKTHRQLADESPPELVTARHALTTCVQALSTELAVPEGRLVLGGFSQGAMLACDVALQSSIPVAGLLLMSGALLNQTEWRAHAKTRAQGLPVFQSHGRQDTVLGFSGAEALHTMLSEAGARTTWFPFEGGHEIPGPVLAGAADFLVNCLG